jgi:hypothetical protein
MDIILGSTVRQQNGLDTFTGHFDITRSSSVDIREATITGNVRTTSMSVLLLRNSTLTGNIAAFTTSLVQFLNPVPTVNGNVEQCGGNIFGAPNFVGGGFVPCP